MPRIQGGEQVSMRRYLPDPRAQWAQATAGWDDTHDTQGHGRRSGGGTARISERSGRFGRSGSSGSWRVQLVMAAALLGTGWALGLTRNRVGWLTIALGFVVAWTLRAYAAEGWRSLLRALAEFAAVALLTGLLAVALLGGMPALTRPLDTHGAHGAHGAKAARTPAVKTAQALGVGVRNLRGVIDWIAAVKHHADAIERQHHSTPTTTTALVGKHR
jgi:hypothetical protein